eukprot:5473236-Amphidinium_carterae.1
MTFDESRAKLHALRKTTFYKSTSYEVRSKVDAVGEAIHELSSGSQGCAAEVAERCRLGKMVRSER